jgi:hypothetical protein
LLEDVAGQICLGRGGEIFFAELEEIDSLGDPAGGLIEKSGLLFAVRERVAGGTTGEEGAAGDGVAKHGGFSVCCQGLEMRRRGREVDAGVVVSRQYAMRKIV